MNFTYNCNKQFKRIVKNKNELVNYIQSINYKSVIEANNSLRKSYFMNVDKSSVEKLFSN